MVSTEISIDNKSPTTVKVSGRWRSAAFELLPLLIICAIIRLAWILIIPVSEAPDEGAHFWVLDFIYRTGSLPASADVIARPDASYYGALATLSYLPHLISAWLMPFLTPTLAFRFGGLGLSLVCVAGAYFLAREIFVDSRLLRLAVAMFLTFHPQLVFVGSYSNNDMASCAVATFALLYCVRLIKLGINSGVSALGLLSGLTLVSKPTGFCLLPVVALSICLSVFLHGSASTWRNIVEKVVKLVFLAAMLASPLLIKNFILFDGDMLGTSTMQATWLSGYGNAEPMFRFPVIDDRTWWYFLGISYWGAFGNMDLLLPDSFYKWFYRGTILAGAGYFAAIIISVLPRRNQVNGMSLRSRITSLFRSPCQLSIFVVLLSTILLNFLEVVLASGSFNSSGPPQGRYLFAAESAIACLLVWGLACWDRLYAGLSRWLVWLSLSGLAFSCCYSWWMLYLRWGVSFEPMR